MIGHTKDKIIGDNMDNKIRIAIVGVGNCASSIIQCLQYYRYNKDNKTEKDVIGLMHNNIGGYRPSDITVVSAFDVDRRKVGVSLSRAIFSEPNCTKRIWNEYSFDNDINNVVIEKGPVLDGISDHMKPYFQVDDTQKSLSKEEIIKMLKERNTDILISYLPVGSQLATEFYADCCLEAKIGFINCIPVFIASDKGWAKRFEDANVPIVGDDIKSQCGATILHRAIINMLVSRGAKIDSTWQTNVAGNTDFKNMISESRLISKRISKIQSISSQIPYDTPVYAGPNGYIESLKDNKVCNIRVDFRICGDVECSIDCKLSVEDSPNSSGVVIDAIRIVKIAKDGKIGGVLLEPSAWMFKHPPIQMRDEDARKQVEEFITQTV